MIDQLTIRGLDDGLEHEVRALADSEKLSLNQAVLKLLRRGAGLESQTSRPKNAIGHTLDWFIGSSSEEQTQELETSLQAFSTIDEDLWK